MRLSFVYCDMSAGSQRTCLMDRGARTPERRDMLPMASRCRTVTVERQGWQIYLLLRHMSTATFHFGGFYI